jgi:hypothetical protein
MPIVEIPFLYAARGVRPRHRNPEVFGLIGRTPVSLRQADDAPVVVTATGVSDGRHLVGEMQEEHLPGEWTIDYRLVDNHLWRPVRAFRGGDGIAPLSVFEIGGDVDAYEQSWRRLVRTEYLRGQTLPCFAISRDVLTTPIRCLRLRDIHDEQELRLREIEWDNRADIMQEAIARAEADFRMIGGVLHVRTPGPWWRAQTGYGLATLAVDIDGPREANLVTSFRADRRDAAEAWTALSGEPLSEVGRIEIIDEEAYRQGALAETSTLLAFAIHAIANSSLVAMNWPDLPGRAAELVGQFKRIGTSLKAALPYEDFDALLAEALLREFDGHFPFTRVTGEDQVATMHNPAREIMAGLDWRQRNWPESVHGNGSTGARP